MILKTTLMSTSHAGKVKGNHPHKKGYPAPPRRSWTWVWQLHLIKCSIVDKLLTGEVGSSSSSSGGGGGSNSSSGSDSDSDSVSGGG